MKTSFFIIALMMSLSIGLMAQATENSPKKQTHGAGHTMLMPVGHRGHSGGLNLTDAQKLALKQSRMAMYKQIQPLKNELGEAMAHQKTLMSAEKPDLGAIDKNIDKIGDLRIRMARIKARQHLELRAQLTDEQRLKFDIFLEKKMGKKGPMHMNRKHNMPLHNGMS